MKSAVRCLAPVLLTMALAACVSPPAPKYQPAIANTELLMKAPAKLAVGDFTAAAGVNNRSLSIRGSTLNGGSDGTFSTYLKDAMVTELQTSGRYDAASTLQVSGVLTHNELNSGVKTGSATVGAEFALTRNHELCFKKTLTAEHQWESSFLGAVAIPAAISNYPTAVQKLLGMLYTDPEFVAALQSTGSAGK